MPTIKEIRVPDPTREGATRVVLQNVSRDYRNAPGNREIARRKRQNERKGTAG